MYKIKHQPEDFIVREVISVPLESTGRYVYFTLWKRNYSTLRALEKIGRVLRVPLKNFGFAGLKDKVAVTEQLVSVKGVSRARLESVVLSNIKICVQGFGSRPIGLGTHEGNAFEIVVRNIDRVPGLKSSFVNFYGEQRGLARNAPIGKALVQRRFKDAVDMI